MSPRQDVALTTIITEPSAIRAVTQSVSLILFLIVCSQHNKNVANQNTGVVQQRLSFANGKWPSKHWDQASAAPQPALKGPTLNCILETLVKDVLNLTTRDGFDIMP